mgnify:CR=1 FL=1
MTAFPTTAMDRCAGGRLETPPRVLGERDLLFCALWGGDGQPHSNEEYSRMSPWGRRILHGDGVFGVGLGMLANECDFAGLADADDMKIKYAGPVYIGDAITAALEITESDNGSGLVCEVLIQNQTQSSVAVRATLTFRGEGAAR